MKQRNGILAADILLSHTHWDHIQGLPFFKPLSAPGNSVCIYGAAQEGVPLEEILRPADGSDGLSGTAQRAGGLHSRW